jgi:hypothetical protein
VLKRGKYYIESPYPEVLLELLKNPTIAAARVREGEADGAFQTSEALTEMSANTDMLNVAVVPNKEASNTGKSILVLLYLSCFTYLLTCLLTYLFTCYSTRQPAGRTRGR